MKERMKPAEMDTGRGIFTIHCKHKGIWPPVKALLDESPEYLFATDQITEDELARINVWRRVCGLRTMTVEKCLSCPNAMVELRDGSLEPWEGKAARTYHPFSTQSRHARRGMMPRQKDKKK